MKNVLPLFSITCGDQGMTMKRFGGGGFVTHQTTTNHPESILITGALVQTQCVKQFCVPDPIDEAFLQKDSLRREDLDAPIETAWEAILVEIRPFLY